MTQQIVLRNTASAVEHGSLWGADRKHHPEVTLMRTGTLEGQGNGERLSDGMEDPHPPTYDILGGRTVTADLYLAMKHPKPVDSVPSRCAPVPVRTRLGTDGIFFVSTVWWEWCLHATTSKMFDKQTATNMFSFQ